LLSAESVQCRESGGLFLIEMFGEREKAEVFGSQARKYRNVESSYPNFLTGFEYPV